MTNAPTARSKEVVRSVWTRVSGAVPAVVLICLIYGGEYVLDWAQIHVADRIFKALILAAIFIAGAIGRLNWRHAVIMLGLYGLAELWLLALDRLGFDPGFCPALWLVRYTVVFWLVALGEAWTSGYKHWAGIVWLLLAALAVDATHLIIDTLIYWTAEDPLIVQKWQSILFWVAGAMLVWSAVPATLAARRFRRAGRSVIAATFTSAVLLYALYFGHLIYVLALPSLHGDGPYARDVGLELLQQRQRPQDVEAILQAVLATDWRRSNTGYRPDWRHRAIDWLGLREPYSQRAVQALGDELRRNRSRALADAAAHLLASHNRLDVAPILLRYALEQGRASQASTKALEKMGIPEAGIAILAEAATNIAVDALLTKTRLSEDFPIPREYRQRLIILLNQDVGESYFAWTEAVERALQSKRTGLPQPVQDELTRERLSFQEYQNSQTYWMAARRQLADQRIRAAGRQDLQQKVKDFIEQDGNPLSAHFRMPPDVASMVTELNQITEAAYADLAIPEPDFDAPTVDLFEQQVQAYTTALKDAIRKHLPWTVSGHPRSDEDATDESVSQTQPYPSGHKR